MISYSEYLRATKNGRHTQITFQAMDTSTYNVTPKTYVKAAVNAVNGFVDANYHDDLYTELSTSAETGWLITGLCDILLTLEVSGVAGAAKNMILEFKNINIYLASTFTSELSSKLSYYTPAVDISKVWITSINFTFHE